MMKRSRVSVGDEDAADGAGRKAVRSALDGHDPGGVRYARSVTTGGRNRFHATPHCLRTCYLGTSLRGTFLSQRGSNRCALGRKETKL